MVKHDKLILVGLFIFSALTSFLFVMYGMNIAMSPVQVRWMLIFSYVTMAYGLANIAILSLAWSSRERWACDVNMLIALCYGGVMLVNVVKTGLGGRTLVIVLAVAVVLAVNWFTVKKVVTRV